ncbi:DUF4932 domain-containing protein [Formosa sp. S-31]|uniref:DUF4932 domain-containing protein n=1 Tax=Formosa sp. S-31 TaxID=2790949 RepID=UPI003EC0B1C1
MKSLCIASLLLVTSFLSFSQPEASSQKLEISFNKNIELLGLAYFIGFEAENIETKTIEVEGKTMPKKSWHNYGYTLYNKYKDYISSENLAQSFTVADHLWLDYLNAFLLQLEPVPNAALTADIPVQYYLNFSKSKDTLEAKNHAETFLNGLNAFSKEIDFDVYLEQSKPYYNTVIAEIKQDLPDNNFISVMEQFYHKDFDRYLLIPSLTIPKGMGFAVKNSDNALTEVYNIFGALGIQQFEDASDLHMGFNYRDKLRELSVHEFGHSFVNPVVARLPESAFTETAHLFPPVKEVMANQGYTSWKACVYEHFVRAGEIIIAEKTGTEEQVNALKETYVKERQFIYLPKILEELHTYENGDHLEYYDVVVAAMNRLKQIK